MAYDALDREFTKTHGNGMTVSHTYDQAGRQTSLWNLGSGGSGLAIYTATYDPVGNRLTVLELDGGQYNYAYDALNQLKNEYLTVTNTYNATYTYDGMGNRLLKIDSGAFTSYTYNAANQQILAVNPTTAPTTNTFDANGNLSVINSSTSVASYTWDPENRQTVAVYLGASSGTDTFTYDANGKRQTNILITGSPQNFAWDGENQYATGDATTPFNIRYTDFPGYWGGLSAFGMTTGSHFLVFDMSGNCRLYVNSDGVTVTDIINYRAFGEEFNTTTPNAKVTHFGALFGGWHDSSGPLLTLFRERWQYATAAVWTSRDQFAIKTNELDIGKLPALFIPWLAIMTTSGRTFAQAWLEQQMATIAAASLYQYAFNNPIGYVDPSGDVPFMPIHPPPPKNPPPTGVGPIYGRYCGPQDYVPGATKSNPWPPGIDPVDDCCRSHDMCFAAHHLTVTNMLNPLNQAVRACNASLCACLQKTYDSNKLTAVQDAARTTIEHVFSCPGHTKCHPMPGWK